MQSDERAALHSALVGALARSSDRATVRAHCPVCAMRTGKPDRRGALSLRVNTGWFRCYKCGARGRLARSTLAEHGVDVEMYDAKGATSVEELDPVPLPDGYVPLYEGDGWYSPDYALARDYLEHERKLAPELWVEARLGATLAGRFAHRVVIPVLDVSDRVVGFVARSYRPGALYPYMNGDMQRALMLYNERALYVETDEPVYVVEGAFDALALWPNAVATLGDLSETQFDMLCEATRPIAVAFDGDAWIKSVSLALRLRVMRKCAGAVQLPPGMDPDEVDREWLAAEARNALEADVDL